MIKPANWRTVFELDKKEKKILDLEKEVQKPDFWQDNSRAGKLQKELSNLKEETKFWSDFQEQITEIMKLSELVEGDPIMQKEVEKEIGLLDKILKNEEYKIFLSGKYDKNNATLGISSGAGGQDAEDWAAMLLRMYQRYCEKKGWKVKILHEHFGEPGGPEGRIGIKNVTIQIENKSEYVYGFLKNETGVHRLVRISPFNAQKLRHTSFTLVEVLPIIEDVSGIEIKSEDLQIDFYRSSGPGGQNVNKRETAVRITHLPTKIQASCQSERTQGENKEIVMKLLYSKLIASKESERQAEMKGIKGEIVSASWGNQIRSYVLHPYKMVKDLRTDVETSDPDSVLDGELDDFVEAELGSKIDKLTS